VRRQAKFCRDALPMPCQLGNPDLTNQSRPSLHLMTTPGPNKRILMLEKLLAAGQADSFGRYALGMEYRKEKRLDDALRTFSELRKEDAEYLPQYLMAGQMLMEAGRPDEAREWLEAGAALARRQGNMKTLGEIEAALGEI
jgi:tetratricopeptide (TPR) repeat protein